MTSATEMVKSKLQLCGFGVCVCVILNTENEDKLCGCIDSFLHYMIQDVSIRMGLNVEASVAGLLSPKRWWSLFLQ